MFVRPSCSGLKGPSPAAAPAVGRQAPSSDRVARPFVADFLCPSQGFTQRILDAHENRLEELEIRFGRVDDALEELPLDMDFTAAVVERAERITYEFDEAIRLLQSLEEFGLAQRLAEVEEGLHALETNVERLRSSLSPAAPEEVLGVARLGDAVKQVSADLDRVEAELPRLREELSKQMEQNFNTLRADGDRFFYTMLAFAGIVVPFALGIMVSFARRLLEPSEKPA